MVIKLIDGKLFEVNETEINVGELEDEKAMFLKRIEQIEATLKLLPKE